MTRPSMRDLRTERARQRHREQVRPVMTTRLARVERGVWEQFERRLERAGLTGELVIQAVADAEAAKAMVEGLKAYLDLREADVPVIVRYAQEAAERRRLMDERHRLFPFSPREIVRIMAERNKKAGWGLPDPDEALLLLTPKVPDDVEHARAALVLVPTLPVGAPYTQECLWTFVNLIWWLDERLDKGFKSTVAGVEPWSGFVDLIRPLGSRMNDPRPGWHWELINFGVNNANRTSDEIRAGFSSAKSPGAGVLVAAALYPEWVQSLHGGVWLPGYETRLAPNDNLSEWLGIPLLQSNAQMRKKGEPLSLRSRNRKMLYANWAIVPEIVARS